MRLSISPIPTLCLTANSTRVSPTLRRGFKSTKSGHFYLTEPTGTSRFLSQTPVETVFRAFPHPKPGSKTAIKQPTKIENA